MAEPKDKKKVVANTFKEFSEDDAPMMAASLAYYVVFSLPPLLVLILMVAGVFMDPAQVETWIEKQLSPEAAEQVGTMVSAASRQLAGGFSIALVLSIAGLIFSATGALVQLQRALNRAWEVEQDPELAGMEKAKVLLTKRALSLGMIVVLAFLIVVAMSLSGIISAFSSQIAEMLAPIGLDAAGAQALSMVADFVVSLLLMMVVVAGMFKVLPDVDLRWKDIRLGVFVTAVLLVIGQMLVGWYIGRSSPGEAFGAAGALAAIMVFVYYASMILLLGAEFTQVWSRRTGRGIRPSKHAVKVVQEKRRIRDDGSTAPDGQSAAERSERHRERG